MCGIALAGGWGKESGAAPSSTCLALTAAAPPPRKRAHSKSGVCGANLRPMHDRSGLFTKRSACDLDLRSTCVQAGGVCRGRRA